MTARSTDQRRNRSQGGQGGQGRNRGQGSQPTAADRFAFPGISYERRPFLPIGQAELAAFHQVLSAMAAIENDGQVGAIAIYDWAAFHCGPAAGHAARRRGTLLRLIEATPSASFSARQYHDDSPHMVNDEAAATGRLVLAEDLVLRYLSGQKVNLGRLAETLELVATQFSNLDGCHKLEGGARAMWAWVLIRQAIDRRTGAIDLFTYAQSVDVMRQAIDLLSSGYHVPGASTIADQISAIDVDKLAAQPGGMHSFGGARPALSGRTS